MKTTSSVAAGLLLVLSVAPGCESSDDMSHEDLVFSVSAFERVEVALPAGNVVIRPGFEPAVVASCGYSGSRRPQVDVSVSQGVLRIGHVCPDAPGVCSVDYTILVPIDAPVSVITGSGDIRARGLRAPLFANAGRGDVTIENHFSDADVEVGSGRVVLMQVSGALDVQIGSGSVWGRDLGCADLGLSSEDAYVDLVLESAPANALLESVSADISVVLPAMAYDMNLETVSGKLEVLGLSHDPTVERHIEVFTRTGDIDLVGSR